MPYNIIILFLWHFLCKANGLNNMVLWLYGSDGTKSLTDWMYIILYTLFFYHHTTHVDQSRLNTDIFDIKSVSFVWGAYYCTPESCFLSTFVLFVIYINIYMYVSFLLLLSSSNIRKNAILSPTRSFFFYRPSGELKLKLE